MARYRTKDEVDMRWNDIRRRLTCELRLQIKAFEERALNELLGGAWEEFSRQLESGEVKELESSYKQWVAEALEGSVTVTVPNGKAS